MEIDSAVLLERPRRYFHRDAKHKGLLRPKSRGDQVASAGDYAVTFKEYFLIALFIFFFRKV